MRNSSLWPLYEKSPVFVVSEKEDLTDENARLEVIRRMTEFVPQTKSRKIVTAQYWMDIIMKHKQECLQKTDLA